ncbi:ABC transporter permease [candidate division KSB1 bacterium]|nr:ABC transporter permease [candidate division KSB1 bacterium]
MSMIYSIKEAFSGLSRAKVSFFISVFTISFLLFLIGLFGIFTLNVNQLIKVLHAKVDIQIFVSNVLDDTEIAKLGSIISGMEQVEKVDFISKDAAAQQFQQEFGSELFLMLEENPLPSSFTIKLTEKYRTEEGIKSVAQKLEGIDGIDEVQYHSEALGLLTRFSKIAYIITTILLLLVVSGSLFVISNTIRLIVIARKDIIYTMRLVGATKRFISQPFLIEGMIQGLLGGIFAFLFSYLIVKIVNFKWPGIIFINPDYLYILIIAGLLFGYISSKFAIKRYL